MNGEYRASIGARPARAMLVRGEKAEGFAVFGADTDVSPYDSGSYASYITGMAVVKARNELKTRICSIAAGMMECEEDAVEFASTCVRRINTEQTVSLTDIAYKAQVFNTIPAESTATHTSPVSHMVGICAMFITHIYRGTIQQNM